MQNKQIEKIEASVIIPAIQFDDYLKAAVVSLGDLRAAAAELIIVLDGPLQQIPQWLACRDRCRVLSTGIRRGSAVAINRGIAVSKGTFIVRLDADDLSLPGRLKKQVEFLKDHPDTLLVGAQANLIDKRGTVIGEFASKHQQDLRKQLLRSNPFVHSSVAIRRDILTQLEGYDERCVRMQDYELFLRIAMRGRLIMMPEVLVSYRIHEAQTSKSLHGFIGLMILLSRRKICLAKTLGVSRTTQVIYDVAFSVAQLVRYMGLRKPRYLAGVTAR